MLVPGVVRCPTTGGSGIPKRKHLKLERLPTHLQRIIETPSKSEPSPNARTTSDILAVHPKRKRKSDFGPVLRGSLARADAAPEALSPGQLGGDGAGRSHGRLRTRAGGQEPGEDRVGKHVATIGTRKREEAESDARSGGGASLLRALPRHPLLASRPVPRRRL